MMVALTLALLATSVGSAINPPAVARSTDDPPIQVSLSSNNTFVPGQRARVYIQAAEDGYVVVLRADAAGHVRVLFPPDPSADAAAPGGRKFEVRGRGDREAFTVENDGGTGVVLAAWSAEPFSFDDLVRGDQWDFSALEAQQSDADKEAALVEVVQSMAGDNKFEYDVATYTVRSSTTAYNDRPSDDVASADADSDDRASDDRRDDRGSYNGAYPVPYPVYVPSSGLSVSLGFGAYCNRYYWSTWGCGPFYDPFYYPVVYRSYRYRPYVYRSHAYRPYVYRSYGSVGGRYRGTTWSQPRVRTPLGGGFYSGSSRGFARTGNRSYAPPSRSYAPRGGYTRSSGGYSRSGGGYSRSGGGYTRSGGGYSRGSGGGGGGRRR